MKQILIILTSILTFATSNIYAHKERIERPTEYIFIFQNNDTIIVKSQNDSLLQSINLDIVNHRRELKETKLRFETGDEIMFEYKNAKVTSIRIENDNTKIVVPKETIEKITEVHFLTVSLLWDGNYEKAFEASYFYIQFDMGTEKSYDKYPYVQLSFSDNEFSKSIIWRQINENSKQWKKL
jgi:uncharacterized protein YxeA